MMMFVSLAHHLVAYSQILYTMRLFRGLMPVALLVATGAAMHLELEHSLSSHGPWSSALHLQGETVTVGKKTKVQLNGGQIDVPSSMLEQIKASWSNGLYYFMRIKHRDNAVESPITSIPVVCELL